MSDDLVTRLRDIASLRGNMSGSFIPTACTEAADEIERLRTLCSDLYHDATCSESFCRLCGEGIIEWDAHRG